MFEYMKQILIGDREAINSSEERKEYPEVTPTAMSVYVERNFKIKMTLYIINNLKEEKIKMQNK
jgi:hypothetical protein